MKIDEEAFYFVVFRFLGGIGICTWDLASCLQGRCSTSSAMPPVRGGFFNTSFIHCSFLNQRLTNALESKLMYLIKDYHRGKGSGLVAPTYHYISKE
jgi:hypothetical protein